MSGGIGCWLGERFGPGAMTDGTQTTTVLTGCHFGRQEAVRSGVWNESDTRPPGIKSS